MINKALYHVVYLAIHNIAKKWTMPIRGWKPAQNRLAVEFAEHFLYDHNSSEGVARPVKMRSRQQKNVSPNWQRNW